MCYKYLESIKMTIEAKCLLKQDLRISNISEEAIITLQQVRATLEQLLSLFITENCLFCDTRSTDNNNHSARKYLSRHGHHGSLNGFSLI